MQRPGNDRYVTAEAETRPPIANRTAIGPWEQFDLVDTGSGNVAQVAALEGQPSTKQTRQLLAVAANYGPMHRAYHQASWPQSVPATAIVSARTPSDTSEEDAQLWRDAQAKFAKARPR